MEFIPHGGFMGKCTANDNEITDIDLTDKDWAGYDEESDSSLGVYDIKSNVIKSSKK